MSEFKRDLNDLSEDFSSKAESLKHRMRETADHAREVVDEKVRSASEQVSQTAGRINEAVHDGVNKLRSVKTEDLEKAWTGVKTKASENPGQTIVIAAAAGFMVGLLFHAATSNSRS